MVPRMARDYMLFRETGRGGESNSPPHKKGGHPLRVSRLTQPRMLGHSQYITARVLCQHMMSFENSPINLLTSALVYAIISIE